MGLKAIYVVVNSYFINLELGIAPVINKGGNEKVIVLSTVQVDLLNLVVLTVVEETISLETVEKLGINVKVYLKKVVEPSKQVVSLPVNIINVFVPFQEKVEKEVKVVY